MLGPIEEPIQGRVNQLGKIQIDDLDHFGKAADQRGMISRNHHPDFSIGQ